MRKNKRRRFSSSLNNRFPRFSSFLSQHWFKAKKLLAGRLNSPPRRSARSIARFPKWPPPARLWLAGRRTCRGRNQRWNLLGNVLIHQSFLRFIIVVHLYSFCCFFLPKRLRFLVLFSFVPLAGFRPCSANEVSDTRLSIISRFAHFKDRNIRARGKNLLAINMKVLKTLLNYCY